MGHLWRVGRRECGCRGEGSRPLGEVVLCRGRDKRGTLARSQRRRREIDGLAAGAAPALASVP